jgi:threonine dehydratase
MEPRVAVGGAAVSAADPVAVPVHEIHLAMERIRESVRRTPLHCSEWLSERAGVPVHLKLEAWQVTGSFKLRGALNAVAAMDRAHRARGLVTASAGNHGQAVAWAARTCDAGATVFVPAAAPDLKKDRIRRFGAVLREVGGTYDDAAVEARAYARETGARFIHGFDDPLVVAGQGTAGLEIVQDLPEVRSVVVPVGGGGLVAGVGSALRAHGGLGVRVLGVQSDETVAMHTAFIEGHVVPTPVTPTLCDGLAGETEEGSFRRAWRVVDALHLVEEGRIAGAIRDLFAFEGVVAEGSGAVGVAAVLAGLDLDGPSVIVISGGNIDPKVLGRILSGS